MIQSMFSIEYNGEINRGFCSNKPRKIISLTVISTGYTSPTSITPQTRIPALRSVAFEARFRIRQRAAGV